MCILSYFPPGTPVDGDALFNGGISNPHGHGWAIATTNSIVTGKSLDLLEALDEFTEVRDRHREGPALFHSRWATHGSVGLANVHPFYVGRSRMTVVAHNGILPASAHPEDGDDRSDTRKFAEDLSWQYRRLDRESVRRALSLWCGSDCAH
jgi:glutamine amidotransferase